MCRSEWIVGYPEVETPHPTPKDGIYASSGLLATNLPLFPGRLQLPVALCVDLLLPPGEHVLRRDVPVALFSRTLLQWSTYPLTRRWASSSDSGVPGRMHSPLSDLCQHSIFPFDCG
jgi:hypothetical protein